MGADTCNIPCDGADTRTLPTWTLRGRSSVNQHVTTWMDGKQQQVYTVVTHMDEGKPLNPGDSEVCSHSPSLRISDLLMYRPGCTALCTS